jgi:hypothetical protein
MEKAMNGWQATKIDTEYYSDYDEITNNWGVFGNESAFCYSLHGTEDSAIEAANEMNRRNKRNE